MSLGEVMAKPRLIDQLLLGLGSFNHMVAVAARTVAALLLVIMTAIVLLQVFFRYGLNNSLSWTEELAKIMMVWMAFLVAPWALRQGVNVSIDMFVDALPRRLRLGLEVVLQLLILWIIGVFFLESLDFWQRGAAIVAATMPVPMIYFYSVVPFGFAALFFVAIELLLRSIMTFIHPSQDWAVPGSLHVRRES